MNGLSFFSEAYTYYDYSYSYGENAAMDAAAAGIFFTILIFTLLFIVAAYVIQAYLLGRIFKKAGIEPWKAWVPIYNSWILLEMGGQKGYWAIIMLIPVVNIVAMVFMYIAMYNIGLKLGKEGAFVLLAIFLYFVWLIWLAVDDSKWKGKKPAKTATA